MKDDQIVECIITELLLTQEVPLHDRHTQSVEILKRYQDAVPHLYAMAEIEAAKGLSAHIRRLHG